MASLRMSREPLLIGAVVADVLLDLALFGYGIARHDDHLMLRGFSRAMLMGVLGGFAILRRSRWALWTFVVFESLMAMTGLVIAFFSPISLSFEFQPGGLVMCVAFGILAAAAALGGGGSRQPATRPSPG